LITHSDHGPDSDPDDPLAVILRPASEYLGPPAGRYEAIRRGAARRRLLRAAAGVGLSCAVAAVISLPVLLASPETPVSPTVPLAPPPASSPPATSSPPVTAPPPKSSPSSAPTPSAKPDPVDTRPSKGAFTSSPSTPTRAPSEAPPSPATEVSTVPSTDEPTQAASKR
jgi:hypothetical protein